jgi:hypothetical protein
MPDTPENDIPLGKRIRDKVNAALADPRREQIQLELLDKAFEQISIIMPKIFEKEFAQLERHIRLRGADDTEKEALIIITAVTTAAATEDGDSPYSPVRRIQIPISPAFTQFTAQQIRDLPNYKKMHEIARDMDVSLALGGLVDGEEGRGGAPSVTVNAMKGYDLGADMMYPDLPPRKQKFDKGKSKGFDL